MSSERGQATVEWIGLLLLVALALVAAEPPGVEGRREGARGNPGPLGRPIRRRREQPGFTAGPIRNAAATELSALPGPRLPALSPAALAAGRDALRRAGRGAGLLWRKAWFACLVYERTRYAFRHPESQLPGYTLPYGVALRMINSCVSPVDLLQRHTRRSIPSR